MSRVKLTLKYDGTDYAGFQIQPNAMTIQEKLNVALSKVHGTEIKTVASGRTDAGVHASGQVVHYDKAGYKIPIKKIADVINQKLPQDIRVLHSCEVGEAFHARYSARVRHYRYRIHCTDKRMGPLPDDVRFCYSPGFFLSVSTVRDLLDPLVGIHDFTTFCSVHDASSIKTREMFAVGVEALGSHVNIDFWGNAFLKNQIRAIVGNLIYACRKGKDKSYLKKLLDRGDPHVAKERAPAKGLNLMNVFYAEIFGARDYYRQYKSNGSGS